MKSKRSQKGSVYVETAMVLPVLLLLLFGIVDFGRWLNQYYATARMAYEVARYGAQTVEFRSNVLTAPLQNLVEARLNEMKLRYNLTGAPVQGNKDYKIVLPGEASAQQQLSESFQFKVTLRTTFKPIFPFFFGGIQHVQASANAPFLFERPDQIYFDPGTKTFVDTRCNGNC